MFARTFVALSATAGAVAAPAHGQQLAILFVFLSKMGAWSLEWVKHFPLLFFFIFFNLGAGMVCSEEHHLSYQHVHYFERPLFLPFASWDVPASVSCAGGAVPERTAGSGPTVCGAGEAVWDEDGLRG